MLIRHRSEHRTSVSADKVRVMYVIFGISSSEAPDHWSLLDDGHLATLVFIVLTYNHYIRGNGVVINTTLRILNKELGNWHL